MGALSFCVLFILSPPGNYILQLIVLLGGDIVRFRHQNALHGIAPIYGPNREFVPVLMQEVAQPTAHMLIITVQPYGAALFQYFQQALLVIRRKNLNREGI